MRLELPGRRGFGYGVRFCEVVGSVKPLIACFLCQATSRVRGGAERGEAVPTYLG